MTLNWNREQNSRMTNAYDLIAIDVDGTLLDSQKNIAHGAAEAIEKAARHGFNIVLVSGRSRLLLKPLYEQLPVGPYMIGSGGAYIASINGEVIAHTPVPRSDAEVITLIARQSGLGLCFHEPICQNCEADPALAAFLRRVSDMIVFVPDVLASTDAAPDKITLFGEREELERLRDHMAELHLNVDARFSGARHIEVTKAGVSKGNALRQLAAHLNLPLGRIVVIGDEENDISMLQIAGLAVAMGNATPEVKAVADFVAPTNDEGGLAWALHRIMAGA